MDTLKKTPQFDRVYRRGKSQGNKQLIMYVLPTKKNTTHYGIVISKKVGKAVMRNRLRRQLKAIIRLKGTPTGGHDIVIVVRQTTEPLDYAVLTKSVAHLYKRHGLVPPQQTT